MYFKIKNIFKKYITKTKLRDNKAVFVSRKLVFRKSLSKLSCVCLFVIRKCWSTENIFRSTKNTFQLKKNLTWFPRKRFPLILGGKYFPEVVKNLEMSYYLLIISNLVFKLLIATYILFWIFVFQFHPL